MSNSKTVDMTKGALTSPIIKFCVPIMFTSILQLLFNAADIVVVGNFVNDKAVAAVGACSYLINLLINLFVGISLGATVTIANYIGAKKEKDLPRLVHTTVALGIIFGVVVGFVGVIGARQFLIWTKVPSDVLSQATVYLRIYFAGTPGFLIYTFSRAVLVPTGDTKKPLIYLSVSGVINVILNLIMVICFHMGVAGVAIATIIAQAVSAILMVRAIMHLDNACRFSLKKLCIDKRMLKNILVLGLPAGFQNSLFSISNVLIQTSVNSLGTLMIAGNAAASNLEGFIFTSMNSFSQGCMTFAGQNYGAAKYKRLNRIYITSMLCIVVVAIVMGAAGLMAGKQLMMIYLPKSPAAVKYGLMRLWIVLPTYFICGIMDCSSWMLRGINRSIFPMITTVAGCCGLRILWIYTAFRYTFLHSTDTSAYKMLIASYPVSWIVTFIVLLAYYIIQYRVHIIPQNNPQSV